MSDRALELACASLTIIESLLLELQEQNILSPQQVSGVLADAQAAHSNVTDGRYAVMHKNVARVIALLADNQDATNICRNLDKIVDPNDGGE